MYSFIKTLRSVLRCSGFALLAVNAMASSPPSATPRDAEQVYDTVCGYCHGKNVGPIILGKQLPAEYIRSMVRSGPNGMPAFRPTEISDAELVALAEWISESDRAHEEYGQ